MLHDPVEIARRLIGFNTVSDETSTRDIADFLSNLLEPAGFSIEQHTYQRGGKEKVNVIAHKGGTNAKLALSGHLDTVPFNETEWRSDPLKLVERDGRFYGRGACDMKGFLGVAISAGMKVPAADLHYPFALVFTSDEEVGCIGARNLVRDKGRIADMFIIGEPTEFRPFILHKGYIYLKIVLSGVGGHSSEPAKGRNAIERALPQVILRVNEFRDALQQITDSRLSPPYATLNTGTISTGKDASKNTIAKSCILGLDIRPIPGQDIEEIINGLRRHVAPTGEIDGITVDVRPARSPTPPFMTSPDAVIVREVENMCGKEATSTSFNTEGGLFNLSGSESVICGPGSVSQAHKPDEFVEGRYLNKEMVDRYENLIRRFCGKK